MQRPGRHAVCRAPQCHSFGNYNFLLCASETESTTREPVMILYVLEPRERFKVEVFLVILD